MKIETKTTILRDLSEIPKKTLKKVKCELNLKKGDKIDALTLRLDKPEPCLFAELDNCKAVSKFIGKALAKELRSTLPDKVVPASTVIRSAKRGGYSTVAFTMLEARHFICCIRW